MKLQDLRYVKGKYLAFVLSESSRQQLIKRMPPKFDRVVCHHVTIAFKMTEHVLEQIKKSLGADPVVKVTGYVADNFVDCFTVTINGVAKKLDGGFYHVTHSLAQDVKPVASNRALEACGGVPNIPHVTQIQLTGEFQLC